MSIWLNNENRMFGGEYKGFLGTGFDNAIGLRWRRMAHPDKAGLLYGITLLSLIKAKKITEKHWDKIFQGPGVLYFYQLPVNYFLLRKRKQAVDLK